MNDGPSPSIASRIERIAGSPAAGWRAVLGGGFTPTERWVVLLVEGRSAFAKIGTTELTSGWLREEHRLYRGLTAEFMPRLLGWDDDGDRPILLLEDLSPGHWPPPWSEPRVRRVIGMLERVRSTPAPEGLRRLELLRAELAGWERVAQDPRTFLGLGVCSAIWLERALPPLIEADRDAVLAGEELLHFDVRSDNICFAGSRTLLVDWNLACIGNARLDKVAWMPSLLVEWGRRAEKVAPNEPELAAFMAGFFAHRARLPDIPDAPRVRAVQLAQLKTALPWAARLLGLPPPVPDVAK
jgi:hypothetical protein